MQTVEIEKKVRINWKETIRQIKKGETSEFEILAEDVNRIRVAASELNKEGSNYSISVTGNLAIIVYD
jgi:hypothetical protein